MKKSTKITLWVVGVLVGLIIVCVFCADVWVSRYAEKRVRAELEKAQLPYEIDFNHIHVLLMTGCVDVTDITFAAGRKSLKEAGLDTVYVQIPHLQVLNFRYGKLLRDKEVAVRAVDVRKMTAKLKVTKTKMYVEADSLSVHVTDLSYNLKDSTFGYNDSVYSLSLERVLLKVPESYMAIEAQNIETSNGGEVKLGKTRIWNNVGKRQLGNIMKEPTTWIDLKLKSVELAPINPFRTDFSKGLHMPKVTLRGESLEALRDVRFPPKHPYPMPQEVLMQLKFPIQVDALDAQLKAINVEVLCTDKNMGTLSIKDLQANVRDFSNKRGSTAKMKVSGKLGTGTIGGDINLHMNKTSDFDAFLHGKGIDTKETHSLIRPLAAIELNCMIDSMKIKFKGDNKAINGDMLLAYHGLNGKVYSQDDIPFKIISKNAGALEYFVNHLIPKSNPRAGVKEPMAYKVQYARKEMEPFPLYMCMPLIMGCVETFLPGFFVSKKVSKDALQ